MSHLPVLDQFVADTEQELKKFQESIVQNGFKYTIAGAPIETLSSTDWATLFAAWLRRPKKT